MNSRLFCENQGLFLGKWYAAVSGILHPRRMVFATGGTGGAGGGSEGGGGTPEGVTLENLGDQLMALEGNKLTVQQVTKALNVFNSGDQAAIKKLLTITKNLLAGAYDAAAFEARLPKAGTATTAATTATPPTPGTPEAVSGLPNTPEAANDNDADVKEVSSWTSDQVKNLMQTVEGINMQAENTGLPQEELNKRQEELKRDLTTLQQIINQNDADLAKKLKAVSDGLPDALKLSDIELYGLRNLSVDDADFTKKFDAFTANLKDDPKGKLAIESMRESLKEHDEKEKRTDEDFQKKTKEFRWLMNQMTQNVQTEAAREQAIATYSSMIGIPLKKDQPITWEDLDETRKTGLAYTKKNARISDVHFYGDSTVIIDVEFLDPKTGKPTVVPMSPASFQEWADAVGVTADIKSKDELDKTIDFKVKEDMDLEYDIIKKQDPLETETHQVKVVKIDEAAKMIELDKEVTLATNGSPTKSLNFGEFAKWFLKRDVMESIPSLDKLRTELRGFNEADNSANKRSSKEFPPIEVIPGEVLKYDDGSDNEFVIADANDKEITMDDDRKMTPASFLRWVKKNGVIKDLPATEEKKKKKAEAKDDEKKGEEEKSHAHGHHDQIPNASYLGKLWVRTRILSPHSIIDMGKTIYELIVRKLKRGEEGRVGVIGERMFGNVPWLGAELAAEFKGKAQHAENEEVNHHIEHMKTMGTETVKHELHSAPNKDILKAAISVAAEKGILRWDDPGLWATFNRFTHDELFDDKGKPLKVTADNHMQAMERYLNHWFGEDTFREFRNKQDSSYNSIKTNFTDVARRLETDPEKNGGLRGALQRLMYNHLHGKYVNPAEYECYLYYAIEAGKLSFDDKVMFLMLGVGAAPPGEHGHAGLPLLHPDRVGAIEGGLCNNFPILGFFTQDSFPQYDFHGNPVYETYEKDDKEKGEVKGEIKKDKDGNPIRKLGRVGSFNFQDWIHDIVEADLGHPVTAISSSEELQPSKMPSLNAFIRKQMAYEKGPRVRLEKAASNAGRWDHDDMDMHGPMMAEGIIEQILGKQGGTEQKVSSAGLKNAYAGFNNFLNIQMEMLRDHAKENNAHEVQNDMRHTVDLLKSFTRFDAILDSRAKHGGAFSRFTQSEYYSKALIDSSRSVIEHVNEVRNYIGKLAGNLDQQTNGRYGLSKLWTTIQEKGANKEKQEKALSEFGDLMDGAMADVGPKAVQQLMLGMQYEKGDENPMVKGIKERTQIKSDSEKEGAADNEFKPYVNQQVKAKVEEIKELQQELTKTDSRTPTQIKADQAKRVQQIISQIDSETYVGESDDITILDGYLRALQAQVGQKKAA